MLAVPPKKPIIHDANGRKMTSTLGPYKVGEKLIATCVTSAGKLLLLYKQYSDKLLMSKTISISVTGFYIEKHITCIYLYCLQCSDLYFFNYIYAHI